MKAFGIIGGGMIARFHAQAIQAIPGAQLVGIYARSKDKAEQLAKEFNCQPYSILDQLLSNPNIEIVTIATPSGTHLEMAEAAAQFGKNIICEKPLEINVERIDKMIAAAEKHGVLLSGIFNRRFNPAVTQLKKAIESNRFGRLSICDAQIKWYRTQEYYDSGKWRGTWSLDGGGALMNQSIHTIDQLLYFAGNVKRVAATMSTIAHDNIEVEDTAVAILEFENGAKGCIQATTAAWSSNGHPAEIQICGEYGSVFLTDDSFKVWDFKNSTPEDELIQKQLSQGNEQGLGANDPNAINYIGHQRNFENVIDAIINKTTPLVTAQEARKAVQLINSIYESAQNKGAWVDIT